VRQFSGTAKDTWWPTTATAQFYRTEPNMSRRELAIRFQFLSAATVAWSSLLRGITRSLQVMIFPQRG
jgi:hypothetical protein